MGLEFCAGLLARHESNPSEALARFNAARRDSEWGQLAVEQMIEVYIGAEGLIDWADESGEGAAAQGEPRPENLAAAEHLLRELRPSKKRVRARHMPHAPCATPHPPGGPTPHAHARPPRTRGRASLAARAPQQVLDALLAIARRGRSNAESAINRLLEVLQADQDYAPALVAAALGYLTLRQAPKARNHLKRIAKLSYQPEYADDFELGWLLLAHVYIQSGKFDIAEELCKRALAANRSCALAYELLGTIKEKELSYTDAAHAYERAWQLEHEAGATVGFKLAFNLLKARAGRAPRARQPWPAADTRNARALRTRRRRSTSARSTCATRCCARTPTTRVSRKTSSKRRAWRCAREPCGWQAGPRTVPSEGSGRRLLASLVVCVSRARPVRSSRPSCRFTRISEEATVKFIWIN